MSLLLLVVVFVTVVIGVFAFGAAAVTPSSVLGARLRALGGSLFPWIPEAGPNRSGRERSQAHKVMRMVADT